MTLSHAEMLWELAGKMGPCPREDNFLYTTDEGEQHHSSCDCIEGQVPRYPSLRRECPCISEIDVNEYHYICGECIRHDTGQKNVSEGHGDWCEFCQGRGWLPVDSLEATMEAVRTLSPPERGKLARIIKNTLEDWMLATSPPMINEAVVYELWENT
ncbi:hypothetical protein LCGC14_1645310 [marine sediment metagenome]|uniref:Uncharacterized protein n=1 Tax=marine sediment metagenome TaxID=412755 RepID=A0A0F9KY90_9ZZZZ